LRRTWTWTPWPRCGEGGCPPCSPAVVRRTCTAAGRWPLSWPRTAALAPAECAPNLPTRFPPCCSEPRIPHPCPHLAEHLLTSRGGRGLRAAQAAAATQQHKAQDAGPAAAAAATGAAGRARAAAGSAAIRGGWESGLVVPWTTTACVP